jgi:hypothetical protein
MSTNINTHGMSTIKEDDTIVIADEENSIPDIADDDDDPVLEAFDEFENLSEHLSLSPEQAFMLYAKNFDPNYEKAVNVVSKLIGEMDIDVLRMLINRLKEEKNTKVLKDEEEKDRKEKDAASAVKAKEAAKKTKTLITIKKGLQEREIKEYIKQIDAALTKEKTDLVDVHCPDWTGANTHHALIPACKKLLVKYCEMGLLGCLINHEYQQVAHELYCCAYVKGRLVDDNIRFENINISDYKIKVSESVKTFWILIDGIDKIEKK